jgi:hypothetical protein
MKTDYDKPNYNDGNWHEWTFDSKPDEVHDKSIVDYFWYAEDLPQTGGYGYKRMVANLIWNKIRFFRVMEVYIEPKTIWVRNGTVYTYDPSPRTKGATKYKEA